jgi:hypothetical protein
MFHCYCFHCQENAGRIKRQLAWLTLYVLVLYKNGTNKTKWHKQNNIQWSAVLCDHVDIRFDLIFNAIWKGGGLYLYLNQTGCDGEHLFYDGGACIICNGTVVAQAKQFSLSDIEGILASAYIDDICSYCALIPSFGVQSATRASNK